MINALIERKHSRTIQVERVIMSWIARWLIVVCLVVVSNASAQAALVINVGNLFLNPGETKSVDVLFDASGDSLQAFGVRLQIDAPANGLLRFGNPPSDAELSAGNYVFAGDSFAALNGPFSSVFATTTTDDTYDGGDITNSGSGISITNTNNLLVRVDITALAGATPGTFSLNFDDTNSTFFDENAVSVDFTSISGTITVNSPNAVPEPSSFALIATCMGAIWFVKRRQLYTSGTKVSPH